jgi:hypothetical protein
VYSTDGTFTTIPINNTLGTILVKYNTSGIEQWIARVDSNTANEGSTSIVVDTSDNIIIAGFYDSGSPDIYNADGSQSSIIIAPNSGPGQYTIKYSNLGIAQWGAHSNGEIGFSRVISSDINNSIYLTVNSDMPSLSIYNKNSNTVDKSVPSIYNIGNTEMYIIKYDEDGNIV